MKHEIDWIKVSGHSGLRGNERVDEICTNEADQVQQEFFEGTLSDYEKMIGGSVFDVDENAALEKKENKPKSSKPAYSYVSMIGGLIQLHKTWAECEARVKGKKGAKYKKVFSKEEEEALIQEWTDLTLKRAY
jgi:ribonuclease HI